MGRVETDWVSEHDERPREQQGESLADPLKENAAYTVREDHGGTAVPEPGELKVRTVGATETRASVSAEGLLLEHPPAPEGREAGPAAPSDAAMLDVGRPGAEQSGEGRDVPRGESGAGKESGGGGYDSQAEALRAAETVADLLGEARSEFPKLTEHEAEIEQTAGLAEAVTRLTEAVQALTRTVEALRAELAAGRGGGSLAAVAVIQKPVADGAAMEAMSVAEGPVKKIIHAILGKLSRAGEWLWSMIVQLVTIREWSISGDIGLPGFAKASLTVTFGG
jgi:hypothetical protein